MQCLFSAEEVRSKSSALIQLSNDIHEMLLGKHYARYAYLGAHIQFYILLLESLKLKF